MNTKYLIGILIVIIIAIGAYLLFAHPAAAPATETSETATTSETAATSTTDTTSTSTVMVTYTDQGFSPSTITIKQGQSVMFMNESSNPMWVASDPHPLHNGYDGTTEQEHCAPGYSGPAPFDECGTEDSFTFTFDQVGTWGYHNHAEDNDQGTVIVTQ